MPPEAQRSGLQAPHLRPLHQEVPVKAGEIPSCFFKAVHQDTSGNDDWTYQGFAEWLAAHPGPDAG